MRQGEDNGPDAIQHGRHPDPHRFTAALTEVADECTDDQVTDVVGDDDEAALDAGESEASLEGRNDDWEVAKDRHVLQETQDTEDKEVALGVVEYLGQKRILKNGFTIKKMIGNTSKSVDSFLKKQKSKYADNTIGNI